MKAKNSIVILGVNIFLCATFISCSTKNKEHKVSINNVQPSNNISEVWTTDNKDGTFINPIIPADYSDPDVIRVGDDFYMTVSSFNSSPGLPILYSKDLVNWTIINHALPLLPNNFYNSPKYS